MPKVKRAELRKGSEQGKAAPRSEWARGWYCAVAVLLREEGAVTPSVLMLYETGGNAADADPEDQQLFREHGLK